MIKVSDSLSLDEFKASDIAPIVPLLNVREIYDNTLLIPFPYTKKDAVAWVEQNKTWKAEGLLPAFAIRKDGELVGGCGFLNLKVGETHQSEVGYWLAKKCWGQGIMTEVIKKMVELGFQNYGLVRITAHVFATNSRSEKVLLKSGFELEGTLRKHYKKDGKFLDGKLYAIISDSLEN